jgi:hypothetical protein
MGRMIRRHLRLVLGAALASASLGGVVLVSQGTAGATASPVTLFVRATSTGTTCTSTAVGAALNDACGTIESAVANAEEGGYTGSTVVITVGAGTFYGPVYISAAGLHSLTIQGAGVSATTVTGRHEVEDFSVIGGTVTLRDLAINKGYGEGFFGFGGGGVENVAVENYWELTAPTSTTTLTNDSFSTDAATTGGAISNVSYYFSPGQLIRPQYGTTPVNAKVVVTNDTFSNDYGLSGGAVYNDALGSQATATATVTNDTFVTDHATAHGGAVMNSALAGTSTANLSEDTFLTDTANDGGGAFFNLANSPLTYSSVANLTVNASILDGASCAGVYSGNYDVVTGTTGCTGFANSIATSPGAMGLTLSLEPNSSSGPETLALMPGSPAIDFVGKAFCTPPKDERGFNRPGTPNQARCDAGAFEFQGNGGYGCIINTLNCQSLGSRPNRNTLVASEEVHVTAVGRGIVAAGTFRHNPGVKPLAISTGRYFGVAISPGNRFKSLVVEDCNLGGGTSLDWWNGSAWVPVVGHPETLAGGCISVTLGPTSSPTVTTLTRISRLSRFGAVIFTPVT